MTEKEELIALRIQVAFLRSREDDYMTMTANALCLLEIAQKELAESEIEIAALRSVLALGAGMERIHA
jgi:hypothetical protein